MCGFGHRTVATHIDLDRGQEHLRRFQTALAALPESKRYETAAECLSGDVKVKLRTAETAATLDHGPPAASARKFTLACYTQECFTDSKTLST